MYQKKLGYFTKITKYDDSRLVKRVLDLQQHYYAYNVKNYYNECTNIAHLCGIDLEKAGTLPTKICKEYIKNRIIEEAFNRTMTEAKEKSKLKELVLHKSDIKTEGYILNMPREESEHIFRVRCRMVLTKTNMKGSFKDLTCRYCGKTEETQKHLIEECDYYDSIRTQYPGIKEKDAYGSDNSKLKMLAKFLQVMGEQPCTHKEPV